MIAGAAIQNNSHREIVNVHGSCPFMKPTTRGVMPANYNYLVGHEPSTVNEDSAWTSNAIYQQMQIPMDTGTIPTNYVGFSNINCTNGNGSSNVNLLYGVFTK